MSIYEWNPDTAKSTNFNEKADRMALLVVEKTLLSYDQVGYDFVNLNEINNYFSLKQ